jgi:hypothetical protein
LAGSKGGAGTKAKAKASAASSGKERKAADPFEQHGDVGPEEFMSWKYYQGSGYRYVNSYLRGTDKAKLASAADIRHIEQLNSLAAKNRLTTDLLVYRGLRAHEGFDPASLKAGDVYTDKGFFSTSLQRSTAEGFKGSLEKNPVLMHIKASKGTAAIPGYKLGTGSDLQALEREVVFKPGSSVKVNKVYRDKGGTFHVYGRIQ